MKGIAADLVLEHAGEGALLLAGAGVVAARPEELVQSEPAELRAAVTPGARLLLRHPPAPAGVGARVVQPHPNLTLPLRLIAGAVDPHPVQPAAVLLQPHPGTEMWASQQLNCFKKKDWFNM